MVSLKGKKVLVVDDQMDNVIAGMEAVKQLGGEPIGVTNVAEAKKLIKEKEFFLVFTDMNMKEGKEAGKQIVLECLYRRTPVFVVTMFHHDGSKVKVLVPEGESYLNPPSTVD
jgi:DNA-binding NtrC family response regulator